MIKGFKGFKKGLVCRDKQYEENKTFEQGEAPELCETGFHFCENPLDVFGYYPPETGAEYAEVEANGQVDRGEDKTCTDKITIKSKISITKLFKFHFDLVVEKIKEAVKGEEVENTSGNEAHANTSGNEAHANTSGYKAHANTSGNEAHANTSGNEAHANTSGYKAHANTSGSYAHANTSGNEAHANTSGNEAHANTSGYKAHANTSGIYAHANTSGNEAHANTSGSYAIACGLGLKTKVKAERGWIVLVDWRQDKDYNWFINNIHRAKVGKHKIQGEVIRAGVWYWFENGKLNSEQ